MFQQPPSVTENAYEAKRVEHEQADARYDRLHAGYDDAPGTGRRWWQFRRRKRAATVSAAATSRPAADSRRVMEFKHAVDEWKRLDASAAERAAAYKGLMERFSDLPQEQRQAITAEALNQSEK